MGDVILVGPLEKIMPSLCERYQEILRGLQRGLSCLPLLLSYVGAVI